MRADPANTYRNTHDFSNPNGPLKHKYVLMNKYFAIIIDNEKNIREALSALLGQYCPDIFVCGVAGSAQEGRELLENNEVDFIFLDISMPKEDGFSFLRSIPSNNYGIIFVTAYQEHALRALKANAIDYLMKPVNPFELLEAVKKAITNQELRRSYSDMQEVYSQSLTNLNDHMQFKNNMFTKLTIPDLLGFRMVDVADLIYLEADDNYTVFYLKGDQKIVSTRTLGEFERILDGPLFCRIHKSVIINLEFLVSYSNVQGNYAELKDGTRLDISRRKLPEFREKVSRYSFSID